MFRVAYRSDQRRPGTASGSGRDQQLSKQAEGGKNDALSAHRRSEAVEAPKSRISGTLSYASMKSHAEGAKPALIRQAGWLLQAKADD